MANRSLADRRDGMRCLDGGVEQLRRIRHRTEVKALRRSRRTGLAVVLPDEQDVDVVEWATAQSDLHHGAYQHPNHVMEESIRLHVIAHAPLVRPVLPAGEEKPAPMMRLIALGGKGLEVVLAAESLGRRLKQRKIQRTPERPFEAAAKG